MPKTEKIMLTCVGMRYRMSERELSQLAETVDSEFGLICRLELEPDNDVDSNAIKVIGQDSKRRYNGAHIGYIRRPSNEPLTRLIKRGAKIRNCILETVDIDDGSGDLSITLTRPSKEPAN